MQSKSSINIRDYHVALIIAGVLRGAAYYLCFAGSNFCDWQRLVFRAGNYFLPFSASRFELELQHVCYTA